MKDDLLDILSNSYKDIDNQKLMDYLGNKLSPGDRHEFEKELVDSELLSDAVEGLGEFKTTADINNFTEQLNRNLQKQLQKKNVKKAKRKLNNIQELYFTIILILVIIILGYFIIERFYFLKT